MAAVLALAAALLYGSADFLGAVTAWSCPGPGRGLSGMALAAGAGDVAASLLYVLAVRSGPFALAVVVTALYPAVTVLLARLVLGERMGAAERTGLALGALGIVLVTA